MAWARMLALAKMNRAAGDSAAPVPGAPTRPPPPRGLFGGTAWRLGHVAGIEVAIDQTWVLIFLLVTVSLGTRLAPEDASWHWASTWAAALVASLLFFASILLHELGHSLVAQRFGLRVRSITLFVFGGVAQLESEPHRPRDEVRIALAGPFVSAALGLAFFAASAGLRAATGLGEVGAAGAEALAWLGRINLLVAGFNLVPGFPLDGGRVLRGVLWSLTGSFERATMIAATNGSAFAYALMAFGVFALLFAGQLIGGLWLVFIGWFLLSAARATVGQMVIERALTNVRSRDALDPVLESRISGSESVEEVVAEAVLRRGMRTLYVVDARQNFRGLVTLRELAQVPVGERPVRRVEEVMLGPAQLAVLAPEEDVWVAFKRMAERNVNQLPVVENGRLLGAVTRERVLGIVQAQLALAPGKQA